MEVKTPTFVMHASVTSFSGTRFGSEGEQISCAFCRQYREGASLEGLANRIHVVLQKHFHRTSREPNGIDYALAKEGLWKRSGEPVDQVIANITGVDKPIAKAVQEYLSVLHGYAAVKDGEEAPYADDALYEESSIDDWKLRETWNFFRDRNDVARSFLQPSCPRRPRGDFRRVG